MNLYESIKKNLSEAKEDSIDDVITDPYDLGLTEDDLKANLSLKFVSYAPMTKSEREDFPECNKILLYDVFYNNVCVGSSQCYCNDQDDPTDYFDQEIQNIIDNPIGLDFSKAVNATVTHSDEPDIVLKLDKVDNVNDFITICNEMKCRYKVKDNGEVKHYIINASGKDYSFTFNDAGLRIY